MVRIVFKRGFYAHVVTVWTDIRCGRQLWLWNSAVFSTPNDALIFRVYWRGRAVRDVYFCRGFHLDSSIIVLSKGLECTDYHQLECAWSV